MRHISKAAGIFTLVALYLLSAFAPGSLHHFLHQENQSALHVAENERDPCHRKIHHNDTKAGCKHPSHVSGQIKCQACTSISFKDHFIIDTDAAGLPRLNQDRSVAEAHADVKDHCQLLSSRGPPRISLL